MFLKDDSYNVCISTFGGWNSTYNSLGYFFLSQQYLIFDFDALELGFGMTSNYTYEPVKNISSSIEDVGSYSN